MFWGHVLKQGQPFKLEEKDGQTNLRLSHAVLGAQESISISL